MSASASRSSLPVVRNVTWAPARGAMVSAAIAIPTMTRSRMVALLSPRPGTAPAASIGKKRQEPRLEAPRGSIRSERPPTPATAALAIAKRDLPVHDHGAYPDRILERLFECRLVRHRRRVEHHEVRREGLRDPAAVPEADSRRRQR